MNEYNWPHQMDDKCRVCGSIFGEHYDDKMGKIYFCPDEPSQNWSSENSFLPLLTYDQPRRPTAEEVYESLRDD